MGITNVVPPEVFEEIQQQEQEVHESFRRYRSSSFGLMTTIVTLSAGSIAALHTAGAIRPLLGVMLIPMACALLQQWFHFRGEMHLANSSFLSLQWTTTFKIDASKAKEDPCKMAKKYRLTKAASDRWFGLADKACTAALFSFIGCVVLVLCLF